MLQEGGKCRVGSCTFHGILESAFSTAVFDNSKVGDSGILCVRQQFGGAIKWEGEMTSSRPEVLRHTRSRELGTGGAGRAQGHVTKKEMTCVTQGRGRKGYILHLSLSLLPSSESYMFQTV